MTNQHFQFNSRLDAGFLQSIYDDDREHAEMVFEEFLNTIYPQLTEIEMKYESGDREGFRKQIHKIKPVLSFVGLTALTTKAEYIEKQCHDSAAFDSITDMYSLFKSELKEMIPIVEGDLKKLKM